MAEQAVCLCAADRAGTVFRRAIIGDRHTSPFVSDDGGMCQSSSFLVVAIRVVIHVHTVGVVVSALVGEEIVAVVVMVVIVIVAFQPMVS